MKYARKIQGKTVNAYALGAGSEMEQELIRSGKIQRSGDTYMLFSQESVNGQGQQARAGDYFKVDGSGCPYPNQREWFLENHRHISGDTWEQIPKALEIWMAADGENEVIRWLLDQGKLVIRQEDSVRYFNAHLWGADLSAAEDAVVVFYAVQRDDAGEITDVDFNFVERREFERTYVMVG